MFLERRRPTGGSQSLARKLNYFVQMHLYGL